MGKSKFLEAVDLIQKQLDDFIFMCDSRVKPSYFTREGKNKVNFKRTILFMLNFLTKSIQFELDQFFELFHKGELVISKQGFSAARKKIKPEAFIELNRTIVDWFYNRNDYKTFMGYRLCAIDASILEINNSKRLKDAFNYAKGTSVELARAMASCIYDIENNMIVEALITKFAAGERGVAVQLIDRLKASGLKNDLILFDRGYPSKDLFYYLNQSNIKFVIRIPTTSYRKKIDPSLSDQTIRFERKGEILCLRVVKFELDSGIEEVLVTNLMDPSFNTKAFKSLYFKRWGIETKYDELKNKLQIQKFTGDTPVSIEQDFYASIFLSNMSSLVKQEADEVIAKEQKPKNLKYEYKVNVNILIGKLKNKLIQIIIEKCPKKRKKLYKKLVEEVSRNRCPIRKERTFSRSKTRLRANKNCFNQRPCI